MRGCRPRALLCGLLAVAVVAVVVAAGGGRALPHLSDDVPFRVNWPGTEFSLVGALRGRGGLWGGRGASRAPPGAPSPPGRPQPLLCCRGVPGPLPGAAHRLGALEKPDWFVGYLCVCLFFLSLQLVSCTRRITTSS